MEISSNLLKYEQTLWAQGCIHIAGVDEAGAGPLAGPLVAAAIILPPHLHIQGVNDSKKVSEKKREALFPVLCDHAIAWGIGLCSAAEVDALNVYQASREAMRRAVSQLSIAPDHILVDARVIPSCSIAQTKIIRGDAQSHSIAAASILAKVYRDRLMKKLSEQYPVYGFDKHRGYGTALHMQQLEKYGPCAEHRVTYAPVQRALSRNVSC